MPDDALRALDGYVPIDWALIEKLKQSPGKTIIKAAGREPRAACRLCQCDACLGTIPMLCMMNA